MLSDERGIEGRQNDQRSTGGERTVETHTEAVHVEHRQRVQQHIIARPFPRLNHRTRTGEQIAVRQLRSLGFARRAGGEPEHGGICGCSAIEDGFTHRCRQIGEIDIHIGDVVHGLGDGFDVGELTCGVSGVGWHHDGTGTQDGGVGHHRRR